VSGADDVAKVKQALTHIPTVLAALGLDRGALPNRRGKLILCPGHQEHVPSCGVTLGDSGTIRVHCFSQCGFRGDIFDLIAKVYGLDTQKDFAEVLGIGADLAGIALETPRGGGGGDGAPRPRPILRLVPPPPGAGDTNGPKPVATLDEEIAIGKAVDVLSDRYPVAGDAGIAGGLETRGLLAEAQDERWIALPRTGLVTLFDVPELSALRPLVVRTNDNGQDYALFRDHRLLLPWRRPDGRVWSFQRRFSPRDGTEDPKMLGAGTPGPDGKKRHIPKFVWPSALDYQPRECFPFGVDAYEAYDKDTDEAWWTEGATDALALRVLNREGWLSVDGHARKMVPLGLPGVQTLDAYVAALGPLTKGRRGFVGVDADAAGQSVAPAWRAMQMALGARESTIKVPPSKDWNRHLQIRLAEAAVR
jgi:hypothetical protein